MGLFDNNDPNDPSLLGNPTDGSISLDQMRRMMMRPVPVGGPPQTFQQPGQQQPAPMAAPQNGGGGSLFGGGGGFVDRMTNPMVLAGLGLASGNSVTGGIGNMANMLLQSRQMQQQQQGQEAAYQAAMKMGLSEPEARAFALNPPAANMMMQRQLEQQKLHRPIPLPYGSELVSPDSGKPVSGGPSQADQDISDIVDSVKKGLMSPQQALQNAGRGGAGKLKGALAREGIDMAGLNMEYKRAEIQMRQANSAQTTRLVGLSQSVDRLIPEVGDLAKEMQNSGIRIGNMAEMKAYQEVFGNTPKGQLVTRYINSIAALKSEMAQAEQGGYAPHESAWKVANEQLDKYSGDKAMLAGLGEIQRILRIRISAIPGISQYGPGMENRYLPGGNQQPDWLQQGTYGPQGQMPPGGGPPQGMQQQTPSVGGLPDGWSVKVK
jgi:hypothetical protein